ncbi:hypothetical protein QJQ45_015694 [Haematococcus lacustris]|nr:hypothetical protein QJQ45_015694 [Haematococcus lacustris]
MLGHAASQTLARPAPRCVFRARSISRPLQLRVCAIGFDFGDREATEPERDKRKKLTSLGTAAAGLLILGPVMKGSVAEAFLGCLAVSQKYQAPSKDVIGSFTKFYSMLVTAGYESWQDYLLDQVACAAASVMRPALLLPLLMAADGQLLMGRDNSVARAVAQGTLGEGAPILQALAHDLDTLQTLAVSLRGLVEYIEETAPIVGSDWVAAACSTGLKCSSKRLGSGGNPTAVAINVSDRTPFITRPASPDELSQWKAAINSRDSWSEALPVVQQYWHRHGFGITSRNSTLRWVKGALEEAGDKPQVASLAGPLPLPASTHPLPPLSALQPAVAALDQNTSRHCQGVAGAQHVLVAGPSGSGKSWLLWDSTLRAGKEHGLRVVDVSGAEVGAILEAARGCGRYPRLRFVLVADHVDFPVRPTLAADLMAGLSDVGAAGWPSNVLLYMAATASSTVGLDPVVARFGIKLFTKDLTEDQFGTTLQELASRKEPETGQVLLGQEVVQRGVKWANVVCGGLSVRAAVQYVDKVAAGVPLT